MRFKSRYFILILLLIITQLAPSFVAFANDDLQSVSIEQKTRELLEELSPEEKVGQLFIVSFQGRNVNSDSQIYDLIVNRHIGGVILNAQNDNFTDINTVSEAHKMISDLQNHEWEDSQQLYTDLSSRLIIQNKYIPLFLAISQEGDSYPYSQVINGLTQMPNEMAIGATWNPEHAEQVGRVFGEELSALGINFYIGPSLDVLDLPYVEGGDDLGTRTFGGDPYWVAEMGKSYVRGLHFGSLDKMAVIAKHFPGRGSSDRLPEEEVATVRKSLEQLKQIELAPFFAVTGNAPDSSATADGLLVSHIRYQGFQGNIRATTRPVSFDQSAQEQLMTLPALDSWRRNGGVVVSDNLGSLAVRKFFDPTGEEFDARQIARNAFLSGNDLMLLDLYVDAHDLDPYATTIRILEFFTQKYREDPAFAQRVDASVKRILSLKFRLYPDFDINQVIPNQENLSLVGANEEVSFDVASESAVLMSPDIQELSVILPRPPQISERIVFITDAMNATQCSSCYLQTIFPVDALEKAVLRLYGPEAGEQVLDSRMSSFTFTDLDRYLDDPTNVPALDSELRNASWIVFSFLKPSAERPESYAMRNFLAERQDLLRDKKIIAFGFNAPYYLDATDISKLTAYYVVFSKTPAFIDMAARILFQETTAEGALPVSVTGIGYDLINAMSPDPTQVIPVFLEFADIGTPEVDITTPVPTSLPIFDLGETIAVRTGIIYDHNRNPVPDGTVVRFLFSFEGENSTVQQIEATTYQGVARIAYRVQNTGIISIRAASDPASNSQVLQIDIPSPEGAEATIVVLSSPQPTVTPTMPEPTITPLPTVTEVINPLTPWFKPDLVDWLAMFVIVTFSTIAIYFFAKRYLPVRWVVRWVLLSLNGGVLAYIFISLTLSMRVDWTNEFRSVDVMAITFAGVIFGWLMGWIWYAGNRWRTNR